MVLAGQRDRPEHIPNTGGAILFEIDPRLNRAGLDAKTTSYSTVFGPGHWGASADERSGGSAEAVLKRRSDALPPAWDEHGERLTRRLKLGADLLSEFHFLRRVRVGHSVVVRQKL